MSFEGLYRGIVVQNNDPENSGRVKVFVPGFNITQIKDWNQQKEEDKYFRVMGKNTGSSLTKDILDSQKEKLVWSEVMMPVFGMSAPGYYHAPSDMYYIGNDSDYLNQSSNKTEGYFPTDAAQAAERLSSPPQNPPYASPPRTETLLDFPQMGSKFCINTKCDKNKDEDDEIPNVLNQGGGTPNRNPILNQLPKVYTTSNNPDLDNDPNVINDPILRNNIVDNDLVPNNSILGVELSVINPTIKVKGSEIPKNSPIYNTGCFTDTRDPNALSFAPPILFKTIPIPESVNSITMPKYSEIPVSLNINGRSSELGALKLTSSDANTVTYGKDDIEVIINKRDVAEIVVSDLGLTSDIQRIQNISPIISNSNPFSVNNVSSQSESINIGPNAPQTSFVDLGLILDIQRIPGSNLTRIVSNTGGFTPQSNTTPPSDPRPPSIPPPPITTPPPSLIPMPNPSSPINIGPDAPQTTFIDLGVVLDIQRIPGSRLTRIVSNNGGLVPLDAAVSTPVNVAPSGTPSTSTSSSNNRSTPTPSSGSGVSTSPPPVKSAFTKTPIMPRAPMAFGQSMASRGGGGGEIFNTVTSKLLPISMRKDSHIGCANNESRSSINSGRKPLNDPNNVKGCNVRTPNASQMHRGPMRAADYNNAWKGITSIPGVGSHVWVRFEGGDANYPIIVGTFMAQTDYKGIFKIQP